MEINQLATFGDQRRMILDTIMELRCGTMDVNRGMAIAANMKTLNDSVQVEINTAKMAMAAQQAGHDFGKVVGMGRRLIGNSSELDSAKFSLTLTRFFWSAAVLTTPLPGQSISPSTASCARNS